MHFMRSWRTTIFLSTLSLRRATKSPANSGPCIRYFYPRSPCGERHIDRRLANFVSLFLSTLSLRRATVCYRDYPAIMEFLSTLSLRRATSSTLIIGFSARVFLSTLSLRRATARRPGQNCQRIDFYPRSPCGERLILHMAHLMELLFLSTLSLRRATRRHRGNNRCPVNFYPRSPCGERRYVRSNGPNFSSISIHALLAESDLWACPAGCVC